MGVFVYGLRKSATPGRGKKRNSVGGSDGEQRRPPNMIKRIPLEKPYPEPDVLDENGCALFTLETLARHVGATENEIESIIAEMMRMENCDIY
jgi:hypothetical protein